MATGDKDWLIARVRERLDEGTAVAWSDTELVQWISEGFRDIARQTETVQLTATINVTAGTQEYTLPADLIRLHQVEFKATGDTSVYPVEYRDFNNMESVWHTAKERVQSTPQLCTMWGYPPSLKLILYPKPSRDGTLSVYYYSMPAAWTTSTPGATVAPVPTGWEDLIVEYATYLALRRDRDPRWQEARTAYEVGLQNMLEMTRRWSDQGGYWTPTGSYLPEWLVGDWD